MAEEKKKEEKKQAAPAEAPAAAPAPEKKPKKEKEEKKKDEKKKGPPTGKPKKDYGPDFRYIVRIANSDLDGTKQTRLALTGIRGVGPRLGSMICDKSGIPRSAPIGNLSDQQIETLTKNVETIAQDVPVWAVNRPYDVETGQDLHLVGSNVDIFLRDDLNRLKKIRSYRGVRHEMGQKVRGQRSKSNGRTGLTLGVTRQKAAEGAAAAEKKEEKK